MKRQRSNLWSALALALPLALAACGGDPGRSEPGSPSADGGMRMAEAVRGTGDLTSAAKLYQQVLKHDPNNLEAALGLAEVQLLAGETERARLTYGEVATRHPKSVEAVLGLAHIAVSKRELDNGQILYERARGFSAPGDVRALFGLGVICDLRQQHSAAQELYRQALAIQPDNVAVRSNLGLSLALSGDPHQAVNLLLDIATAPSAPTQARQNLALAYGLLGNAEAAEAVLSGELDRTAIQNNLRYYQYLRSHGPAAGADTNPKAAEQWGPHD